jgi:hypothetical protein
LTEQLKLATPADAVAVVAPAFVQLSVALPAGVTASVTAVALSAVSRLPYWSSTDALSDIAAPAVMVLGGWVVKTSLLAEAGVIASSWMAEVRPVAAAVIVGVPTVLSP